LRTFRGRKPLGRIARPSDQSRFTSLRAPQIPTALPELGRLRELTFREVGEGTGQDCDLDEFDGYYRHLVLWSKSRQEIAGAYRIGNTVTILKHRGIRGLYTSTLFRFDTTFFQRIGPALELGRSFILPQYQRHHSSLLFLWKGIGSLVVRDPGNAVLFGPVSISNNYGAASRDMLFRFFREQNQGELAQYVRPHRPFRSKKMDDGDFTFSDMFDLELLSDPLADLEPDRKGVPILLKQYVRLGGILLGFNVDREFSDALDGLVLVDLRNTQRTYLDRYLGVAGASSFLTFQAVTRGLNPVDRN
jgi:putative hemolysin